MNSVRKNITLSHEAYEMINDYAKRSGMSFSEFLRESALKAIVQNQNASLLEYISANCAFVDEVEQKELEALGLDFENVDGKELTLDELLQD